MKLLKRPNPRFFCQEGMAESPLKQQREKQELIEFLENPCQRRGLCENIFFHLHLARFCFGWKPLWTSPYLRIFFEFAFPEPEGTVPVFFFGLPSSHLLTVLAKRRLQSDSKYDSSVGDKLTSIRVFPSPLKDGERR